MLMPNTQSPHFTDNNSYRCRLLKIRNFLHSFSSILLSKYINQALVIRNLQERITQVLEQFLPPISNMSVDAKQCNICGAHTITNDRPWISYYGLESRDLKGDFRPVLQQSAESGCRVCLSFWQAIFKYYGERLTPYTAVDIMSCGEQVTVSLDVTAKPDLVSTINTSTKGCSTTMQAIQLKSRGSEFWELVVSTKRGPSTIQDVTDHHLTEGKDKTTPVRSSSCGQDDCKFCPRQCRQHPSGNTGSPQAIETIRSWLSDCIENHPNCGGDQKPLLPQRILEILDHATAECRLLVTNEGQMDRYACLSHRWCIDTERVSLKQQDLEAFQERIPQERLYPLLRDAIIAAGKLGLKYIWIDCMVS
jgi:hypothetical protein